MWTIPGQEGFRTQIFFYGEVISTYSRAQAIADGVLVDAGSIALEAGFTSPVALTSAVWADCVAWTDEDSAAQIHQDQSGRLWHILYLAAYAIRTSTGSGDQLLYEIHRIPRDGYSTEAVPVTLKLIIGPGDHGEPVLTTVSERGLNTAGILRHPAPGRLG